MSGDAASMVVVVDLPDEEHASERIQALIDAEAGPRYVVRRAQLVGPGPLGYRFHVIVEEMPDNVVVLPQADREVVTVPPARAPERS